MTFPVSRETATMSFEVSRSYGTPLGLMTHTPALRWTPDTLPNVPCTRPESARRRLARHTTSRSPMNRPFLDLQQAFHERRQIGARGRDAAERIVELPIDAVELVINAPGRGPRRERLVLHARHPVLRLGPRRIAARVR